MGFSYMKSKLLMFNKSGVSCLLPSKNIVCPHGNRNRTLTSNPIMDLLQLRFAHSNTSNHVRLKPSNFLFHTLSSVACFHGLISSNVLLQHCLRRRRFYSSVGGLQQVQKVVNSSRWWLRNHKFKFIGCCFIFSTIAFGCMQRIPVSNRIHVTMSSDRLNNFIGSIAWEEEATKGKILSPSNPESIRVKRILSEIIQATHHVLGLKNEYRVSVYVPRKEDLQMKPLIQSNESSDEEYDDDSIVSTLPSLFDYFKRLYGLSYPNKRVQNKLQKVWKFGIKYGTKHLNGLNWEVMMVDSDTKCAHYIPNGRILIGTAGWPKKTIGDFTDAELATILSHEVGHGVAVRHSLLFRVIIEVLWILALEDLPDSNHPKGITKGIEAIVRIIPSFFSRRRELEADRIGMMLMAAAGYDPRQAPEFYEKYGDTECDFLSSTHPTGEKRAKELNKVGVMSKAVDIYNQVQAGHRIETFV